MFSTSTVQCSAVSSGNVREMDADGYRYYRCFRTVALTSGPTIFAEHYFVLRTILCISTVPLNGCNTHNYAQLAVPAALIVKLQYNKRLEQALYCTVRTLHYTLLLLSASRSDTSICSLCCIVLIHMLNICYRRSSIDRILTGFPTTVAEAEALEKFGVKFADLVVLVPDVGCSEVMESIMELYEGKVTKVSYEKDVATMCTSAVSLLGFDAPRSATNVEDNSAARVAAAPSFGFIHMEGEQVNRSHGAQGENTVAIDKITGAKNASADEELSAAPDERDEVTTMSPSEHILAKKRGTAAHDEVIQAAKRGAELKRAQKQAIREKKRAANEAQRLDTPFYVAVASGKPKARYHAPVPIVPSRITERLSSAVADDDTNVNTQLEFGPLVIDSPASDCLLAAGIRQPTGIQMEGMGAIADGESVILHAMTGSGKTLAFLLPLMQRWTPSLFDTKGGRSAATAVAAVNGARSDGAFRVLLALPTRELAIQVAREAVLLAGGVTAYVELLVESGVHHDLGKVTAPIVVGSAKVLER